MDGKQPNNIYQIYTITATNFERTTGPQFGRWSACFFEQEQWSQFLFWTSSLSSNWDTKSLENHSQSIFEKYHFKYAAKCIMLVHCNPSRYGWRFFSQNNQGIFPVLNIKGRQLLDNSIEYYLRTGKYVKSNKDILSNTWTSNPVLIKGAAYSFLYKIIR